MTVTEPENEVDPTYYADVRGEAFWDTMSIWTLPVAAVLLIFNNDAWAYFGLVGGGIYLYFAGRGISARIAYQRRGISIGKPSTVKQGYVFLFIWGLISIATIVLAVTELP